MSLSWLRIKAYWAARATAYRMSLLLAIFSGVEIYMHTFVGTNPNWIPPWGYFRMTLAVFAVMMFGVARLTWFPPDPIATPAAVNPSCDDPTRPPLRRKSRKR